LGVAYFFLFLNISQNTLSARAKRTESDYNKNILSCILLVFEKKTIAVFFLNRTVKRKNKDIKRSSK